MVAKFINSNRFDTSATGSGCTLEFCAVCQPVELVERQPVRFQVEATSLNRFDMNLTTTVTTTIQISFSDLFNQKTNLRKLSIPLLYPFLKFNLINCHSIWARSLVAPLYSIRDRERSRVYDWDVFAAYDAFRAPPQQRLAPQQCRRIRLLVSCFAAPDSSRLLNKGTRRLLSRQRRSHRELPGSV